MRIELNIAGDSDTYFVEVAELPRRGDLLRDPRNPSAKGKLVVKASAKPADAGKARVRAVYIPSDEEDF